MKTRNKIKTIIIAGAILVSTTVMASVLINWEGTQTVSATKEFINAATNKIIAQEKLVSKLKSEKAELQRQLDAALAGGGNNIGGGAVSPGVGSEEIDSLRQQIIDKNNEIIRLENEIISKQNDIDHLTRELTRANNEVAEQQRILDEAKSKLDAAGINLYYTEE